MKKAKEFLTLELIVYFLFAIGGISIVLGYLKSNLLISVYFISFVVFILFETMFKNKQK